MLPGLLSQEGIPIAFIPISLFRGLKRREALCHHRCALDLKKIPGQSVNARQSPPPPLLWLQPQP